MSDLIQAHVYIKGKVQGVFFRWWTQRQAEKLGLTGWVRNLPDGRVEAVFEGPTEKIEQMIERCKKGSAGAQIEKVEIEKRKASGVFSEFEIER